jgi:hypothetical protein
VYFRFSPLTFILIQTDKFSCTEECTVDKKGIDRYAKYRLHAQFVVCIFCIDLYLVKGGTLNGGVRE